MQGNAAQLQGLNSRPINLSPGTQFGVRRFGDSRAMDARGAGLQQVLTFDTGMQMIAAASGVMQRAVSGAKEINRALRSGGALTTVFPQTNLGRQLEQVANVMEVLSPLGMNRQIFFCGMGAIASHSDQLPRNDPRRSLEVHHFCSNKVEHIEYTRCHVARRRESQCIIRAPGAYVIA